MKRVLAAFLSGLLLLMVAGSAPALDDADYRRMMKDADFARADGALYEVKKRTHSPANGGHERRGQQRAKKSLAI